MPIYEYRCYACGHELEVMQKMSDPPLQECPDCGKKALKKLISAAGFRLKGGGWYETDFKKKGQRNLHEAGAGKEKAPEKPEPKTEASKGAGKDGGSKGSSAA
jgi:putative FmdB family regulatory protein